MAYINELIKKEEQRQKDTLMMIPSENYASKAVREAVGSVLMNKYSEGYPYKRYYQGNKIADEIETLTIEKAKKLFKVEHVNVQPYSGSPANSAVLFGLLNSGDKIMGLKLSSGGHLTHGHPDITFSGKFFKSVQFGTKNDGIIDYDEVEKLAKKEKPKLLFIGTTAYPLILDWKKFSEIANSINAILVADVSHVSGLILAGVYPSPVNFAHVVTTTTHKTLRGPRGAMIMVTKKGIMKDPDMGNKIDRAVFPGLQGGPHDNVTAAKAQAFFEALKPEFKIYANQIVKNAKALAKALTQKGFDLVSGGTDTHLILMDVRSMGVDGMEAEKRLEKVGIIANRNSVPGDPSPFKPSGVRLGTPSLTTRGMKEKDMNTVADLIHRAIKGDKQVKAEVLKLCKKFPGKQFLGK